MNRPAISAPIPLAETVTTHTLSLRRSAISALAHAPYGLILCPCVALQVDRLAEPGDEDRLDSPDQPLGVAVPRAEEVQVADRQIQHVCLGGCRNHRRHNRRPPVLLSRMVDAEVV